VFGKEGRDANRDDPAASEDSGELGDSFPVIYDVLDHLRADDLVKGAIREREAQGVSLKKKNLSFGLLPDRHMSQKKTCLEQALPA
jgi:hypothetical protein